MGNNLSLAFLCLLAGAFGSVMSRANLIRNGDFEDPEVPALSDESYGFLTYYGGESFPGWTVGGNSVDIVHESFWRAASGSQSVDLTGFGAGSISQTIATIPGENYLLRFALTGSPNWVGSRVPPLIVTMEFFWKESVVDVLTVDTAGLTVTSMGWSYCDYPLTAITDQTVLTFTSLTDLSTPDYRNRGAVLDDVALVAVPEAFSYWNWTGAWVVIAASFLKRRSPEAGNLHSS